jgi:hypothetical protein
MARNYWLHLLQNSGLKRRPMCAPAGKNRQHKSNEGTGRRSISSASSLFFFKREIQSNRRISMPLQDFYNPYRATRKPDRLI